jgi:hypothetical protein
MIDAVHRLGQDRPLYTKRPVTIAAVRWNGEWKQIEAFVGANAHVIDGVLTIHTPEGDHRATVGDFIVRGVKDEFYPVKPDIFEATYFAGRPAATAPIDEAALAEAIQREVIDHLPDPLPGGLSIAQAAARTAASFVRGK